MNRYKTILLAIDFSNESRIIAEKARAIAEAFDSELHVVYVVQPLSYGYADSFILDLSYMQAELTHNAENYLQAFSKQYGVIEKFQHLLVGGPAKQIHELTESIHADLIVMGTHGQHGISLLLGATANSVLHGSKCDVLAVRVGEIT